MNRREFIKGALAGATAAVAASSLALLPKEPPTFEAETVPADNPRYIYRTDHYGVEHLEYTGQVISKEGVRAMNVRMAVSDLPVRIENCSMFNETLHISTKNSLVKNSLVQHLDAPKFLILPPGVRV